MATKLDDATLDRCLFEAIAFLREHWFGADTGIVAAAIIEPTGLVAYATSLNEYGDVYSHAEKNALDAFHAKYGRAPVEGSAAVVTLSPCALDDFPMRLGKSCSNRLA